MLQKEDKKFGLVMERKRMEKAVSGAISPSFSHGGAVLYHGDCSFFVFNLKQIIVLSRNFNPDLSDLALDEEGSRRTRISLLRHQCQGKRKRSRKYITILPNSPDSTVLTSLDISLLQTIPS
jgi:hypothetical protein